MNANSPTPTGASPRTPPPPTDAHHALGLLPRIQSGQTTRPNKQSLHQRQRDPERRNAELVRMNKAFEKQGLPLSQRPPQLPSTTIQDIQVKVDRVADWLVETGWWATEQVPSWPQLPNLLEPLQLGASQFIQSIQATFARPEAPGGTVYILDCPQHERRPEPAFDVDLYVKALGQLYQSDRIVRVPVADCGWSFAQNVVKAGPNGTMILGQPYRKGWSGRYQQIAIDALKAHFETIGQPYVQLPHAINFANVEWFRLPDGERVLVLTDVHPDDVLWKDTVEALIEAYGTPQHLLRPSMRRDAAKVSPGTGTYTDDMCYDPDLAWKPLDGNPKKTWALVHEQCYLGAAYRNLHTGEARTFSTMTASLEHLTVGVIPSGLRDAARLVMNSVAHGMRLLLPRAVSKALMHKLSQTGYEVLVPEPGQELGNTDPRVDNLFAVHCVVAQTEDPETPAPEPAPEDKPEGKPADKSEL